MQTFLKDLITEWRRLGLPREGEAIVVAVSGGADSVSLLVACDELQRRKKLDLRIVAANFDHKLRPESSGSDLEFVKQLTIERKIELAAGEWSRSDNDGNLEQNARKARYEFLQKTAANVKASYILTGHTMNDQAETVLMNLIRGCGVNGLGGMRVLRELRHFDGVRGDSDVGEEPFLPFAKPEVQVARPLLRWAKRRDTENFCLQSDIDFCRDPMNEDVTFRRVWIRKVLIPMLEEVNPKIVDALCRTADALQGVTGETGAVEPEPVILTVKELKGIPEKEIGTKLRNWLRAQRGDVRGITHSHINAIAHLIVSRKSGKYVELPRGGRVAKSRGRLVYSEIKVDK